ELEPEILHGRHLRPLGRMPRVAPEGSNRCDRRRGDNDYKQRDDLSHQLFLLDSTRSRPSTAVQPVRLTTQTAPSPYVRSTGFAPTTMFFVAVSRCGSTRETVPLDPFATHT